MHLLKTLLLFASVGLMGIANAQSMQELEACQALVVDSENDYNAEIYTECGFSDLQTAIAYWVPLAEENGWANALYEIYTRHTTYPNIKKYLYKAAELHHPKALIIVADELFQQKKIPEAMRYYSAAIQSGDLDEDSQGLITGRLAMLYADPNSPYYDIAKALPLLQKASQQRQALPNNVMGFLTLFGLAGVPQDAEEAFKYYWRAVLLDCPAAEENLGFFLLAREQKIDLKTLVQELSARTYSCNAVPQTSISSAPYHITFTPKQCADLNYYAQRLVDTALPFKGKEECAYSADMGNIAEILSK